MRRGEGLQPLCRQVQPLRGQVQSLRREVQPVCCQEPLQCRQGLQSLRSEEELIFRGQLSAAGMPRLPTGARFFLFGPQAVRGCGQVRFHHLME